MIRALYAVRRKNACDPLRFRQFWESREYQQVLQDFKALYQIQRLEMHLTLDIPVNQLLVERQGMDQPVDGIIDAFWDNVAHFNQVNDSPEGAHLKARWAQIEADFVDRTRSFMSFTGFGAI